MLDKILDMMAKWDHFGQGIFILIILGGTATFIERMFRYFVILVRGYKEKK